MCNTNHNHKNPSPQGDSVSPPDCSLQDRFRGAMVLSAVGDALGWPTEFLKESTVHRASFALPVREFVSWSKSVGGRWWGYEIDIKQGEYSDDTQLNLAVSRSISRDGVFDPQHFAYAELPLWLDYERGGGRAIKAAAKSVTGRSRRWNTNFYKAGAVDYCQAGGNGAVMRNVPIALANICDTDRLVHDSIVNSIITHGHPRGILGTVIMAVAIVHTLTEDEFGAHRVINRVNEGVGLVVDKFKSDDLLAEWTYNWAATGRSSEHQFLDLLLQARKETVAHLNAIPKYLNRESEDYYQLVGALDPQTKGSGIGTACVALFMALKGQSNPAESVIVAANQLGSDTDTIASCLGALLGARIGFSNISRNWRDHIVDGKYVCDVADRICRIATGSAREDATRLFDREAAAIKRREWSDQIRDLLGSPENKGVHHPTMGVGVVEKRVDLETAKKGSIMRLLQVRFECGQSCTFRGRFSDPQD